MYSQIASNKRRSVLLLLGFVLIMGVLGYVIAMALGDANYFYPILIFAISYALVSYFASAQIALAMSGAREVQKRDAPELYRVVENLAITAGLPTPKVYIITDPSPNAFATGRDPQHAVVAVTTGLLQMMDKTELEGVLAHELSHVGNYDIRFMALVVALVAVIAVISDLFLRFSFFGGGNRDRDRNDNSGLFALLGIAGAILAPIVAVMLQMAVSRRREYLADASGAMLTRYPEGLERALIKIDAAPGLSRANTATAPLYIANPLKGNNAGAWMQKMFSTHPPMADRIARLKEMEKTV